MVGWTNEACVRRDGAAPCSLHGPPSFGSATAQPNAGCLRSSVLLATPCSWLAGRSFGAAHAVESTGI